jgi:hypothetical protein
MVFLSLYKATRDPIYFERAFRFLELCIKWIEDSTLGKEQEAGSILDGVDGLGLFEGIAGVLWLACELGHWADEKGELGVDVVGRVCEGGFPCFTDI